MEVLQGLASLPFGASGSVATVGFFDGVHLGHRAVFDRVVAAARDRRVASVAVTFDRHPREVLTPGREPPLLTTLERKADLIDALGMEALVVLEFTEEFSKWPPEAFVQRVLVEGLQTRHAVVGSNFTFGHGATGTLATLIALGERSGFTVEGMGLVELEGRPVSSSSIRESLSAGDLHWPRRALGRRYAVDGRVVAGAGRGADLGYPTANLAVSERLLLPKAGIYAGAAVVRGSRHVAAISVGTSPTFGGEPLHVEAFLLDFQGDVRGEPMAVEFWEWLREEERFDTAMDLVRQMKDDVERTRAIVPA
jgi:riboflavin kinase / FMN adenylyltransferase